MMLITPITTFVKFGHLVDVFAFYCCCKKKKKLQVASNNTNLLYYSSECQGSDMGLTGLKSKCGAVFLLEALGENCFLTFSGF